MIALCRIPIIGILFHDYDHTAAHVTFCKRCPKMFPTQVFTYVGLAP